MRPEDTAMAGGDKATADEYFELRDYFAAKAMQGFCAYGALSDHNRSHTIDDVADDAYAAADAMLRAREVNHG